MKMKLSEKLSEAQKGQIHSWLDEYLTHLDPGKNYFDQRQKLFGTDKKKFEEECLKPVLPKEFHTKILSIIKHLSLIVHTGFMSKDQHLHDIMEELGKYEI